MAELDEQMKAKMDIAAEFLSVVVEIIGYAKERGIPSGHLYAMLMPKTSFATYSQMITILKRLNLITEKHNVLYAYPITYFFTLDSHDYVGPFYTHRDAHRYAERCGYSTYQFVPDTDIPKDAVVLKPT